MEGYKDQGGDKLNPRSECEKLCLALKEMSISFWILWKWHNFFEYVSSYPFSIWSSGVNNY